MIPKRLHPLTAILLLVAAAQASPGRPAPAEVDATTSVRTLVRTWLDQDRSSAGMRDDLRGLGDQATSMLFEALAAESWSGGDTLLPEERTCLQQALLALGDGSVRDLLTITPDTPSTRRLAILLILEGIGSHVDITLAAQVASIDPIDAALLEALEETVFQVLLRDVRGFGQVRGPALAGDVQVGAALVRAVARTESPVASTLLVSLLGIERDLDAMILQELATLIAANRGHVDPSIAPMLARFFKDEDPFIRRAAARAAGPTLNHTLAEELVVLLEDPEPGVRDAAHWSLRELSGVQLPGHQNRWKAWLEGQRRWYESRGQTALDHLYTRNKSRVLVALREIAAHPLHRLKTVPEVERLLGHNSPTVRLTACATLIQLGFSSQPELLTELLDDEHETVSQAAHGALQALTGQVLPPSPEPWLEFLASR